MPRSNGNGPIRRAPGYGAHMSNLLDRERQDLRRKGAELEPTEIAVLKEEDREGKAMKQAGGSGKKPKNRGSRQAHEKRVAELKRKKRAEKKAKRAARAAKKSQGDDEKREA